MPRWVSIARNVHRAIALAIGLHFCLIATTGAIFIFEPELKRWARDQRGWQRTPGDLGPDACVATIKSHVPGWEGTFLSFPDRETPFYSTYLGDESSTFWTDVFVDPGTARIVGTADNAQLSMEGILQYSIQLHIRLCAGELGRRLVGVSVLLFIVELVTGVVLWWTAIRRLSLAFAVRLRRSRFLALYDTHRLAGIVSAPWLLIMAFTGLLWAYPGAAVPLVYWCCGEPPPAESDAYRIPTDEPAVARLEPHAQAVRFGKLVDLVNSKIGPATIEYLALDDPDSRIVRFGVRADAGGAGQRMVVEVDRLTGAPIELKESPPPASLADRLTDELAHELHYGTFGGLATRIIYLLACVAVDMLYVSGVAMWLMKRRKRLSGQRVRSATA